MTKLEKDLAELKTMPADDMRTRWLDLHKTPPPIRLWREQRDLLLCVRLELYALEVAILVAVGRNPQLVLERRAVRHQKRTVR